MRRWSPVVAIASVAMACGPIRQAAAANATGAFDSTRAAPGDVVTYTITISGRDVQRLRQPPSPDFSSFQVVGGPSSGSSTQISIINGQVAQSTILTFSWELVPWGTGTLAVPAFALDLGGGMRAQVSRAEIEVGTAPASPAGPPGPASPPGLPPGFPPSFPPSFPPRARADGRGPWDGTTGRSSRNSDATLRMRAIVEDDTPWLGEEIVLTHVLDFQVGVAQFTVPPAEFPGFSKVQRDVAAKGKLMEDPSTGERFQRAPLARWAIVPLATGVKELPSLAYALDVRTGDEFFPLFGGIQRITKATPPVTVTVRPLPDGAPDSFSGAVGSFQVEASLSPASINQGDSTALKVTVSGTGTFQGVVTPHFEPPPGIRVFDPEVHEDTRANEDGHTVGKKTFSFPLLATSAGRFELPAFHWSFFDPHAGRFVTRETAPVVLDVKPSSTPGVVSTVVPTMPGAAPIEIRGSDIRHVRATLGQRPERLRLGEVPRWFLPIALLGPVLTAGLGTMRVIGRLRRADPSTLRVQRAGKRARQRLAQARVHAKAGRRTETADAAARAVGGFVADRLLLGEAEPSPAEAGAAVAAKLGPETGGRVQAFLSDCDFARFASGAGAPEASATTLADEAERLLNDLTALPAGLGEAA